MAQSAPVKGVKPTKPAQPGPEVFKATTVLKGPKPHRPGPDSAAAKPSKPAKPAQPGREVLKATTVLKGPKPHLPTDVDEEAIWAAKPAHVREVYRGKA